MVRGVGLYSSIPDQEPIILMNRRLLHRKQCYRMFLSKFNMCSMSNMHSRLFCVRKKHYLCLSAPAMPLPPTPPQPGPGQYEVRRRMICFAMRQQQHNLAVYFQVTKQFGEPKHFMSGSVFVSTTGRWTGDAKNIEQPGPGE